MINTQIKCSSILILKKDFYSIDAINETLELFKKICLLELKEDNKAIFISFISEEDMDLDILKQEFSNYVLGLMKNKSLV
jgi:hypothetical protein